MKKYGYLLFFAVSGSAFFSILSGNINIYNIIIGFFAASLATLVINKGIPIHNNSYKAKAKIKHYSKLLVDIFVSSYRAISKSGNNSCVKTHKSSGNISSVTEANSITLTPGTVTLDMHDNYLTVLQFDNSEDSNND